ncbi:MAG: SusC/RagA family TonB-linked outer membrane protein [Prevotella sp.]|jgi:TonB-linked SusC/RagA family outer membrane protein
MVKRLTMILAGLFLTIGVALAQSQVSGTVTDENGEPVVGAAVRVSGTKTGTVTDINGNFSISAPANSRLDITYIGMHAKSVKAGSNLKIVLEADDKLLDEVMVVAYGTQTKSSFTGSAAVVDSKDLSKKIATNVADALVGSVPGLQLTGASGQPGAAEGDIHIRGIASMYANTKPLIIVDGAPYSASLSNIPQDDIESVTVLKDAASAALYGARGAAGVILITTKKGDAQKTQVNAEAKWGVTSRSVQDYETITDPGEFMETYYKQFYNYAYYGKGMSNEVANKWVNDRIINDQNFGLQYNPYTLPDGESLIGLDGKLNPKATLGRAYDYKGEKYYILPDDWKDAAYKHGFRQEYNVNVSGGTQKGSFYSSLGYLDEDGVIDNSSFQRFTGRLKADYQVRDWLKVYTNVGYIRSTMESNPNLSDDELSSANMGYYTQFIAPIYPLYVRTVDANGNPVIRTDKYGHPQYDYGVPASNFPGQGSRLFMATGNPIGANKYNEVTNTSNQFQGQFNFDVNLMPWLIFKSVNALNYDVSEYSKYGNPFYGSSAGDNGNIDMYKRSTFRQNYTQTLNFHKGFGKHDVQAMLGHEWYKISIKNLQALARGGFSPDIKEINAFSDRYNSYSYTRPYNVEGYFANALYNYDNKYFAQGSYRRDASSRFAKDNRWGNFWSLGGAWIISKEDFFKTLGADWVDNLKLKVSIGQQGNDGIGDFNYIDLYILNKGNNTMLPGFAQIGNKDITWETTTNFNLGLEFGLLGNRLNGEFNYYNKKTTDLLFWLSIPESQGSRGYYGNVGDIRNSGVEFLLSADVIRTKDIVWNVSANISHNATKILKLDPSKTKNYGGFSEANHTVNLSMWYEEDGPLYNAFMPEYAGVGEDGQALYWVDENILNDPNLSNSSKPATQHSYKTANWNEASYYAQGSLLPKANGGFATSLKLYDFDFNATFDYQLGGKVYDNGYSALMSNVSTKGSGSTMSKDILKAWSPNNTSSDIPRFQYQDSYTTANSTRFLVSAKYLNFQSFSVGYTVPSSLTRKFQVDRLRVYVQGENLYFWSARKGLDPRYSFAGSASTGVNSYAPVRTIMGGIQVSF